MYPLGRLEGVSKVAHVVTRVRTAIASGEIRPGERVIQRELAEQLGVSITPVREALRVLEAEGLVTRERGVGVVVAKHCDSAIVDLYALRSLVEGATTRAVASRIRMSEAHHLEALLTESRGELAKPHPEPYRLASLDREFHFSIYDAGPNYASSTIGTLWSFVPTDLLLWRDRSIAELLLADHAAILESLLAADDRRAEQAMCQHLRQEFELRQRLAVAPQSHPTRGQEGSPMTQGALDEP